MTEEEKLAEEYAKANAKKGLSYREVTRTYDEITGYPYFLEDKIKKAFLAGLKAGRPKWHDLRKDPNDLPESYMSVVNQDGENVMYDYYCKSWRYDDADEDFCDAPIAWCEIPKYTEE